MHGRLPDFLIVGAPKAGTTTLASALRRHPSVWMPRRKELEYFTRYWKLAGLELYEKQFAPAPAGALVGEATPGYLHAPGALERIVDVLPEVRLLAILRDPVDRLWSQYHYLRNAQLTDHGPIDAAIEARPDLYVDPGCYAEHVRRALMLVDPEQLFVLFLDDLRDRPGDSYAAALSHIGVDPTRFPGPGPVENQSYAVRYPFVRRAMHRHNLWRRLPGELGFVVDEWNRRPVSYPTMPEPVRRSLARRYRDDTIALEDVLGREVPWKNDLIDAAESD